MMRFLAATALIAGGAPAAAAVYTYEYQGLPIVCHEDGVPQPAEAVCGVMPAVLEGFSGRMTIDEARFPGGSLAGASLAVENWHGVFTDDGLDDFRYEVLIGRTSYTGRGFGSIAAFGWLDLSGYPIGEINDPNMIEPATYRFTFDENRMITAWSLFYQHGGSTDWYINSAYGDGWDWLESGEPRSTGPGTWTRVSPLPSPLPDAPAPIPLPASGTLLGAGLALAGLGAARRRRAA